MTDTIGPSVSDVVRALTASKQTTRQNDPAQSTATSSAAGRSGNEGDSVTLSEEAQEVVQIRSADGTTGEGRLLTGLKLITPQGQRADSEAAIRQLMSGLGIEGDLDFSVDLRDDGSIAVKGAGAHSAEIEAAINADPTLQKTMRDTYMSSEFAYMAKPIKAIMEASQTGEAASDGSRPIDALREARQRIEGANYTFMMREGVLTTAFVDPDGQRFGGIAPEPANPDGA